MNMEDKVKELRKPFPASDIEWRVGMTTQDKSKGQALPYLTYPAVADKLDDIVGPENWSIEYRSGPAGGVLCRLGINFGGTWVYKENGAENTDVESIKGGMTDAFKRAAAIWGIGRYLYKYTPKFVELRDGKYFVSANTLPVEFLPEGEGKPTPPRDLNKAGEGGAPTATATATAEAPKVAESAETKVEAAPAAVAAAEVAMPTDLSPEDAALVDKLIKKLESGGNKEIVISFIKTSPKGVKLPAAAKAYIQAKAK